MCEDLDIVRLAVTEHQQALVLLGVLVPKLGGLSVEWGFAIDCQLLIVTTVMTAKGPPSSYLMSNSGVERQV
jgi:hypothetical protein